MDNTVVVQNEIHRVDQTEAARQRENDRKREPPSSDYRYASKPVGDVGISHIWRVSKVSQLSMRRCDADPK